MLSPNLFDEKPIIVKCFYHFTQSLYKKKKKIGFQTDNKKYIFITLKNIEILCFIKPSLINNYIKFLKDIKDGKVKDMMIQII